MQHTVIKLSSEKALILLNSSRVKERTAMAEDSGIIVGLDLGTSKITVAVAEKSPENPEAAQIIGIGQAPSRGIRKGMIINLEQAVNSVSDAIADAESIMGGLKISSAAVAFSGLEVQCRILHGKISLGRTPRAILPADIEQVVGAALKELQIGPDRCVVHTIPFKYAIDGRSGVENPLDMTGMQLEVEVTALVIPVSVAQNVVNCIESAGVKVEALILKPIAEALGTLSEDERAIGASLVSIGGGTTSVTVCSEGHLLYAAEIPVGGDHITNDLACVKKIPFASAEELKKQISMNPEEKPSGTVTVEVSGRKCEIDRGEMSEIISSRLDELFTDSIVPGIEKLQEIGLPTDVILTGGVALTPDFVKFAESYLKVPVRIGEPVLRRQMQQERNDCRYCAVCGIVVYLMEKRKNPYSYMSAPMTLFRSASSAGRNSSIRRPRRPSQSLPSTIARTLREVFRGLF